MRLTGAVPDRDYYLQANDEGFCDDLSKYRDYGGLRTDQDGAGNLTFTRPEASGTHTVGIDAVGDRNNGPAEPRHREIASGTFTTTGVP